VTALNADGLATVPYVAATMATPVARFLEAQGGDFEGTQSIVPFLESAGVSPIDTADGGLVWVDGTYTGTSTGSRAHPYTSYTLAVAAASAGDTIMVMPGTIYAEDLALVAGVDVMGFCAPGSDRVAFTGQVTAAYAGTCNLRNLAVTEAGAGASAIEVTGAAATVLNISGCSFTAGALADMALLLNAANAVVTMRDSLLNTITANANETVQIIAGQLWVFDDAEVSHADGVTGPTLAIDMTGAGVATLDMESFRMQGGLNITSAAQNPTVNLMRGRIETGANSAIQTASTNPCTARDLELISADAGGLAVDGAGVFSHSGVRCTGTATQLAAALNAGTGPIAEYAWERPLQNSLYVDGAYAGGASNGSQRQPYTTYALAAAAAAAGDVIYITPGTYTEDLACVAGVDVIGLCPPESGRVLFNGQVTAAFAGSVTLENLAVTEAGAGASALEVTGAAATLLTLRGCTFTAGALADMALLLNAANAVVRHRDTSFSTITANANETIQIIAGTLIGERSFVTHADGVTGPTLAIDETGAGVATVVFDDVAIQGGINVTSAAQNPTNTFHRCRIETGANSAIQTASTNEFRTRDCELISADAGGLAVDGAGVFTYDSLRLTGAATVLAAALNAAAGPGDNFGVELAQTGIIYVDAAYIGGQSDGTKRHPYTTITLALAAAGAGDQIYITPGNYIEDFALIAEVNLIGLAPPRTEDVQITGEVTAGYIGAVTLQNLYLTEDVNATVAVAGANATVLNLRGCIVESTAAATFALDVDAVNATVFPWDTLFRTLTGNANETVLMSAGTLFGEQVAINHADGVTGPVVALEADGTGVTDIALADFQIQGGVNVVSAAQNPTTTFFRGSIVTGAISAIQTASTGACVCRTLALTSTDALGFAVDGVGVFTHTGLALLGAADQLSPALNAGAGPGADSGYASLKHSGSVAVAQIIQGGQPIANETLTVGADVYEADGVGGNINFAIAGGAAGTMANLLAAAVANGTENLFWDAIGATNLRLRSADGPQGNIMPADPNIALTEAMTNYVFDCGNVNMNTLAGHTPFPAQYDDTTLTINAGHVAAGEVRISFPFAVASFHIAAFTAAGVAKGASNDTYVVDNGDVYIGLSGAGADPLIATDIVSVIVFS
jgi:hypothetical protein